MSDLKDKLTDAANNLGASASEAAEELQNRARDAWDTVQYQTRRAARKGSTYARKNPLPTALAALGCGLILGLLLNRNSTAESKSHSVSESLQQSRGALLGLLVAFGALLKRTFSTASTAAGELVDHVGEDIHDSLKPLKKAARDASRKLGL